MSSADDIIGKYWTFCEGAIEEYSNKYWPCQFTFRDSSRCVNLEKSHVKGHQNIGGRIEPGQYSPSERVNLNEKFREQLRRSCKRVRGKINNDEAMAFAVHQETLTGFFHGVSALGPFGNRKICFCCLTEQPDNFLPCGHSLCTRCVCAAGTPIWHGFTELKSCLLCGHVNKEFDQQRKTLGVQGG